MFNINAVVKSTPKANKYGYIFKVSGTTTHPTKTDPSVIYFNGAVSIDKDLFNENYQYLSLGSIVSLYVQSNWDQGHEKIPYEVISVSEAETSSSNVPFFVEGDINKVKYTQVGEQRQCEFVIHTEEDAFKCFFFTDDLARGHVQLSNNLESGRWRVKIFPRDFVHYDAEGNRIAANKTWLKVFKFELISADLISLSKAEEEKEIMEESLESKEESINMEEYLSKLTPITEEDLKSDSNDSDNIKNNTSDKESNELFKECVSVLTYDWIAEMDRVLEMLNKHYETVKSPELKEIYKQQIIKRLSSLDR